MDPDGRANNVVVIGQPHGAGNNFEIAGSTWIEENVKDGDSVKVFHAKDYKNASDLLFSIKNAFGSQGIDSFVYFGHSYANALTTQADDETRNERVGADAWIFSLEGIKFNDKSNIYLFGCNAGNLKAAIASGVPCISQVFANETGATVWGYDTYAFATADPKLAKRERLPTNADINTTLPNNVEKVWFVCNNGKGLTKFIKQDR